MSEKEHPTEAQLRLELEIEQARLQRERLQRERLALERERLALQRTQVDSRTYRSPRRFRHYLRILAPVDLSPTHLKLT